MCQVGEKPLHDHLRALQAHMIGIRKQVIECNHRQDAEVVDRLAEENARQQALAVLRESPALKAAVDRGLARLVYGLYDMETGAVKFFDLDGDYRIALGVSDWSAPDLAPPQPLQGGRCLPAERRLGGPLRHFR